MTLQTHPITDRAQDLKEPRLPKSQTGLASGVNIEPGSEDDGWTVPPPVRLADGTMIQLYKDGEAWHAAFDAMATATSRICLELYIFASDDTGRAVADLLSRKAREGVKVFVLYDSFGSLYSDRKMFDRMVHAGVNVRQFHPMRPWECDHSWRPINRDHRKLILIDDHIGGLGGMNLGREYAGSWVVKSKMATALAAECDYWRDNAIGISGPAVAALNDSFARTWAYAAHGGPISRAAFVHGFDRGEFGLLASTPTRDSPLEPMLNRLLRNAMKSIDLTMAYFAPDEALITELCAAADRGARVRLMLPGRCDVKLLVVAARSFYERLMSHGVQIFERQGVILHAKTIVVDGRISIIGSTNLDYRSIEYNLEISAVIQSEEFGSQIVALFENDISYARPIDPAIWKHRPFIDRLGQWIVSRARYLL